MGIMHKLLKRRDLERQNLLMDLTQFKDTTQQQSQQNQITTSTEQKDLVEVNLVPKLATEDNQFTAEHIMQLCKFLAEKSKRKKTNHKRLLSSPNKCKPEIQNQRESNRNKEMAPIEIHLNRSTTPLDTNFIKINQKTQILTNHFENNTNFMEDLKSPNSLDVNKFQKTQEKRDILLKIRHQIFERKRQQQQLGEQQLDVWRPW